MSAITLPRPPARSQQVETERPVLLVEQDAALARLLRAVLTDAGYSTRRVVPDWPDSVLEAVAQQRPRCVVLDSSDGAHFGASWAVAVQLHAWLPELPIVMCTTDDDAIAEAQAGATRRSRAARFAGVVPQPFGLDELLNLVAAS